MNTAQQLKSEGQQLALQFNAAWSEQAMTLLEQFCRMTGTVPFLFEDFRAYALSHGLPAPTSSHAWGALATTAKKRSIITGTGEYKATKSPATHGHVCQTWRAA